VLHKYMAARPSLAATDDEIRLAELTRILCQTLPQAALKE
jgi:cytochrome o ubiquinol oxidase subunit 2